MIKKFTHNERNKIADFKSGDIQLRVLQENDRKVIQRQLHSGSWVTLDPSQVAFLAEKSDDLNTFLRSYAPSFYFPIDRSKYEKPAVENPGWSLDEKSLKIIREYGHKEFDLCAFKTVHLQEEANKHRFKVGVMVSFADKPGEWQIVSKDELRQLAEEYQDPDMAEFIEKSF